MELTKMELWDFMYSQICKTCGINKCELALSKEYKNMKRRFDYFVKKKQKEGEK